MLREVTFRLPPEAIDGLNARAADRDVTPGQVLRDLLRREFGRGTAKRSHRADEPLVARLQRLLAVPMAEATTWDDLHRRLGALGFSVRPAGGGLTLHGADGTRLCKSSELGFAYARFVKRFGAPMPGHPHRMAHLLGTRPATKKAAGPLPDGLVLIADADDA